ncbi:kinesin-like protein KIF27 [Boleophthalmus pectinirostris]|uniref:kinesin-like protein KIF27 n=1 Tax=Boleophthalmus pectinirostris TaxID=150288 RepID=UPI0024307880|nr:kinesin-like protein KIF27 [Boleophthalmus pectinirostris]
MEWRVTGSSQDTGWRRLTWGYPLHKEDGGLTNRVAQDLFCLLDGSRDVVDYTLTFSYLELYMEDLRDLLELSTANKTLYIREDRGNTVVVGAIEQQVCSAEEIFSALATGNARRHTSPTGMNNLSSRSHAIVTLQLHQRVQDPTTSEWFEHTSKLHLVDLAGSERADKTGNTGLRLRESVHINTGLLALGNVIRTLTDPKPNPKHVPYRDSKLTRLLRDSLEGRAHTLMIACVSPSERNFTETLSVLRFASKMAAHSSQWAELNVNPKFILLCITRFKIPKLYIPCCVGRGRCRFFTHVVLVYVCTLVCSFGKQQT